MSALISKPGLTSASTLSIPQQWSAQWFRNLIANQLSGGDVRNATSPDGNIVIAGNLTTPYGQLSLNKNLTLSGIVVNQPTSTPGIQIISSSAGRNLQTWTVTGGVQLAVFVGASNAQIGTLNSFPLEFFVNTGAPSVTINTNGTVSLTSSLGVNGATPPSQVTGWGTPTGAAKISNFPGASATLVQCSEVIAQILTDLKNIGFYAS